MTQNRDSESRDSDVNAFHLAGRPRSLLILILSLLFLLFGLPVVIATVARAAGLWAFSLGLAFLAAMHLLGSRSASYRGFWWLYGKGRSPRQILHGLVLMVFLFAAFALFHQMVR